MVFEVLSRASSCLGWMARVREYGAVPSIRRCVLVDGTAVGLIVVSPAQGTGSLVVDLLTGGDVLRLPEIGVEMPVGEFYKGVAFDAGGPPARSPDRSPPPEAPPTVQPATTGCPMASITIPDVDEALGSCLCAQAASHGRSVEDEARDVLHRLCITSLPDPDASPPRSAPDPPYRTMPAITD